MTRPYTFVTPSGETVRLLTTDVSGGACPFDTWPDAKQNEYLHLMQGHLKDLYMDGSPAHYYELTGITMGDGSSLDTTQIAFYREDLIDGTSWKITQALRVSGTWCHRCLFLGRDRRVQSLSAENQTNEDS